VASTAAAATTPPETIAFEAEWDGLVDRVPEPAPWVRPGWVAAWRRAFGRGRLELVAVRRGSRLVALAVLEGRSGGLASPTNYHTPAFDLLAEDADAEEELVRRLVARRPRHLELRFLEAGATSVERLRREAGGYLLLERLLERSPYVLTGGDWAEYEHALDGKVLRELRRRRRRLERDGALELTVEDGTVGLESLLDEGFRVEGAAWKQARGSAIASSAVSDAFYRDVATWAAGRGTLRLAFLRLDGTPIAFDYAIEEEGRHYLLKTGYEPVYRAHAPGMLLRHAMIERAFQLGLESYEFLGRDEPWKLTWTRTVRPRIALEACRRSPTGVADWAARAYARPLATRALALVGR
jgi:CelD/BcsL family acetyltransferase involved in cellulose biosynthesis